MAAHPKRSDHQDEPPDHTPNGAAVSRRKFIGTAAAGTAGAVALGTVGAPALASHGPTQSFPSNRFGRMFPQFGIFIPNDQRRRDAVREIGRPGGLMDANDNLAAGPVQLIVDPALSVNNPDNPNMTAGVTFFGQFLDHDMTFDASSQLAVATPPQNSPNVRTPSLDLDSVYGGGPTASPQLYESDRIKLRIESGGLFEDLPRMSNGTAIIADPRNDENAILSGLQAAFILFHNKVVDRLRDSGQTQNLFAQARQLVTWHYHWLILREFLPLFIGQSMVNTILSQGRRYYHPTGAAFIPVEFQIGYRMGHSMIRPSYRLNLAGNADGSPFFGMIFDPAAEGQADPIDLRGGRRARRRFVGWGTFFNFNDGNVRNNKRLDLKISTPLFRLPLQTIASGDPPISLPERNLLRHFTWELPAGQLIAQSMGHQLFHCTELTNIGNGVALETQTPLWYYILSEAQRMANGLHLGPTGGRIIGEVFIGLMQLDPNSWVRTQPNWRPTLPSTTSGDFRMTDFLRFAGVSPDVRGQ
jgi:hypothetical protein